MSASALTLDEVFVLKAPNSNWDVKSNRKLRLTPLSKKSCLIHGIDPSILQQREYSSFITSNGQDPEITTMKYEMYMRTRDKLFATAKDERAKLLAAKPKTTNNNDSYTSTNDSVSAYSKTSLSSSIDRKESTLVEIEKRRLEKVAARQQKELMRMLAFETKSKEVMDKVRENTEEQKRKEEQRKKEKRKRDLAAREEARRRELHRKAQEDAEASLQRMKMQDHFNKERQIREQKLREEKEIKRRSLMKEKERQKRQEQHRLATRNRRTKQSQEGQQKLKEREAKEREREAKLELKRLVDLQAAEVKRKETHQRIETNLNNAREREEIKRRELVQKQARHEEFINEITREKVQEAKVRLQHNEAMDRKRLVQLKKTKEKEEIAKLEVRSKIEQEEEHLKNLDGQRRKEQLLIKAERDLQLQMKKDNLVRIKKAQEYHLKEMLRKADESDRRCQDLKREKESLLQLRRKNAHESKIKKDKLLAVLDKSTSGGTSGIKKLLKSVSMANNQMNESEEASRSPQGTKGMNDTTPEKNVFILSDDFLGVSPLAN